MFPRLFSVFWLILIMIEFGWPLLFLIFTSPSVPLRIFWWLYQKQKWQLVSPSPSCFTYFYILIKVNVFIFLFHFFHFYCVNAKSTICDVLFFLLIIPWFGCLDVIKWFVCISKSDMILCMSFSRSNFGLHIDHMFVWANFLHNSQWITLPTQSYLVL